MVDLMDKLGKLRHGIIDTIGGLHAKDYCRRNPAYDVGQDFVLQYLDNRRGVRTMKEYRLKVEIAQRELSDLGCGDHTKA